MAKKKSSKSTKAGRETKEQPEQQQEQDFYIAAIGASAGGLDALKKVFGGIEPKSGIAYVVISHLDPHHSSMLPELLQKTTSLPVKEITSDMDIVANAVYVIAPDYELVLEGRRFHLEKRVTDKMSFPINTFLMSLADHCAECAIAVILSGTGTDGAAGVKAIKEKFGLVLAQDPATAQYKGMPSAVLATGAVDQVLPPEEIGPYLAEFVTNRRKRLLKAEPERTIAQVKLNRICALLHRRTGHDFSGYKQNTIIRRISRRMDVHRLSSADEYIHFLQQNPEEMDLLFGELLIGVTNFFRDPPAWEIIKQKVFPIICEGKEHGSDVRIWVPGVSTGEEAYSMAILFHEFMDEHGLMFKPTIFGTDIDETAVDKARRGIFPQAISADVSQQRLERWFVRQDNAYAVNRDIRETVIFAPQNMLKDPPFSRLDLICCRNVLIYMNSSLQKKLIPLFHYSLNPNGVLFLGSSESISEFTDLFTNLDHRWKIFKRADNEKRHALDFPMTHPLPDVAVETPRVDISHLIGQKLLEDFVPSCVVIDQQGKIQYIHGRTGKYLEPAPGEAQWDVFKMAREGLKNILRAVVHQALTQDSPVTRTPVKVKTNGDYAMIHLHVKPLLSKERSKFLALIFEEIAEAQLPPEVKSTENGRSMEELEQDLAHTRENLQSTVEELETSNEELRSMNEEYQSTNEELKSANEELETGREELQSLNEELTTVNAELQEKINGLNEVQKELQMFLDSLDIPTVFLDEELRIVRFTMQAANIFNIIDSDIGRPIQHFASNLNDKSFLNDAREVLRNLRYKEKEVQTQDGHWYLRRTLPYRTADNRIRGIAVNFVDIEAFKAASDELKKIETIVGSITDIVSQPLVILDSKFNFMRASDSFYERFRLSAELCIGRSFFEVAGKMMDTKVIKDYFDVVQEGKKISAITAAVQIDGQATEVTIRAERLPYGLNHIWCVVFKVGGEKF